MLQYECECACPKARTLFLYSVLIVGGGEGGGGRGQAGGSAKGGVKRQHPRRLVDAGVVALQPGSPQHKLEVAKSGDLEGECLCVSSMNAEMGGKVVGNGSTGRDTAIDQF